MCVVVEGVLWAEEVLLDRKTAWCSLVILHDIVILNWSDHSCVPDMCTCGITYLGEMYGRHSAILPE